MKKHIPSHQRKKFEEERARRILSYIYPEKYIDAVLSESPDIINKDVNVGTEVTTSLRSFIQESLSRASHITGKTASELTEIDRANIKGNRVFVSTWPDGSYVAGTPGYWGNEFDFQKIYEQKLEKLNSKHFQKFSENNLFIFAWLVDTQELQSAINYFITCSNEITRQSLNYYYDLIFIFSGSSLIEIKNNDHFFIEHDIPKEVMHDISHLSFKTIFGMTKEEFYKQ